MVSKPKIKALVDLWLAQHLEHLHTRITLADVGVNAKQKDVTKVKEELLKRANKLRGQDVEINKVPVEKLQNET